jgi:hypothetical protein
MIEQQWLTCTDPQMLAWFARVGVTPEPALSAALARDMLRKDVPNEPH